MHKKILNWIFSNYPEESDFKDINEKFLRTLRVTARCRFNASRRISIQSKFSFFTNTIFSLGLILIPLLQMAQISKNFSPEVLASMQFFLAVAVLVYSMNLNSAQYDLRIRELLNCANEIKKLIRNIEEDLKNQSILDLKEYKKEYASILEKVENHENCDFFLSQLEMPLDYKFTGIKYIIKISKANFQKFAPLLLPATLLLFEAIFILDMIGATKILTSLHSS